MSDFTVIKDIGESLKKLLDDDPWTGILSKPEVTFSSPKEIKTVEGSNKVSLFLYQVLENTFSRNEEPRRVNDSHLRIPPLVLDLFYLVTAYSADTTQEKYILGKVMQIFYDNAVLTGAVLQGSLSGTAEEIKLLLNPLSLDDLTKIWSAFPDTAYKLSGGYMVTPVKIDSTRETGMQRVISKEMNHAYIAPER